MTPWGRRNLQATAYQPAWKGLDIAFAYIQEESGDATEVPVASESASDPETQNLDDFVRVRTGWDESVGQLLTQPDAKFSVRLVNQLPVRITNCKVVIGIARRRTRQLSELDSYQRQQIVYGVIDQDGAEAAAETVTYNTMAFQFQSVHKQMEPGDEFSKTFPVRLNRFTDRWHLAEFWGDERVTIRTLTHTDQNSVWIVGTMSAPATLKIDEDRTDFLPDDATHYFIQRVQPEDMPDLSALFPSAAETSEEASSDESDTD